MMISLLSNSHQIKDKQIIKKDKIYMVEKDVGNA